MNAAKRFRSVYRLLKEAKGWKAWVAAVAMIVILLFTSNPGKDFGATVAVVQGFCADLLPSAGE